MNMPPDMLARLQAELADLDNDHVDVEGVRLKPSQCYRFHVDPAHVLFNTNCPDSLRQKVNEILSKYVPDETRTQ